MGPVWDMAQMSFHIVSGFPNPNDSGVGARRGRHAMKYDSTKATRQAAEVSRIDSGISVMSTRSHGSVRRLPQCVSHSLPIVRVQHREEGKGMSVPGARLPYRTDPAPSHQILTTRRLARRTKERRWTPTLCWPSWGKGRHDLTALKHFKPCAVAEEIAMSQQG